jgi:hypothetical protein
MPYANTVESVDKVVQLYNSHYRISFPSNPTINYGAMFTVFTSDLAYSLISSTIEAVAPGALSSFGAPSFLMKCIGWYGYYKLSESSLFKFLPVPDLFCSDRDWLPINASSELVDKISHFIDLSLLEVTAPDFQNQFVQYLYDSNDLSSLKSLTKLGLDDKIVADRIKENENYDAEAVGLKNSDTLTWLAAKAIIKNNVAVNTDDSSLTDNSLKIIEKARAWVK